MVPVICQVKHNPPHTYGDCVRACVASVLELTPDAVPHFFSDGDGERAFDRMRIWLADRNRIPAYFALPGDMSLGDALYAASIYDTELLLFCSNADGDHCVVARGGAVVHDPAWVKSKITGPHSTGVWILIILAKV